MTDPGEDTARAAARSVGMRAVLMRRATWGWAVAGLVLAFVVGSAYAWALRGTGDWHTGLPWERALMLRIHALGEPRQLDLVMLSLPWTGTNLTLLPVMVVAAVRLMRRGRGELAAQLLVVTAGSYLLNLGLKHAFDRARPDLWPPRGQFAWPSFPSGHAIVGVSMFYTLAILLHRERGWRWPYVAATVLLLVNLYSRVYLGVHWPTDVIAGVLIGAVWLLCTLLAFRPEHAEILRRTE